MINLVILFLLGTILFTLLDVTTLPSLINSVIAYIQSSSLYSALQNLFGTVGQFLNTLFLDSSSVLVTSYGYELGSIVWLSLICRIVLVIFLVRLLIKVVL